MILTSFETTNEATIVKAGSRLLKIYYAAFARALIVMMTTTYLEEYLISDKIPSELS